MKAMGKRSVSSFLMIVLNVGWYGLGIVLSVTTVIVAVSLVTDVPGVEMATVPPSFGVDSSHSGWHMTIPVSFTVDSGTHHVTAPTLGIEDAQIRSVRGLLRFSLRKGAFFLGNAILLIVLLIVTMCVVGLLRAVFRTLRDGQPFVPANATRIRWIAYVGILSELIRSAVVFYENSYAMTYFSAEGLRFDARPDFNIVAIINALILLVIAEVFRAGTRLDEDQSLTV